MSADSLIHASAHEFSLLARCAQVQPGGEGHAAIRGLAASGVEWETFLALASRHGLLAPVSARLDEAGCDDVPATVRERLRQALEENARHNLHLTRGLLRALATLQQRDIQALPYKGPMLSQAAYGTLVARESYDLDLLVPQVQALAAMAALREDGYQSLTPLTPRQQAALLRSNCEFVLHDPQQQLFIDLHWRIAPLQFGIDFDSKSLWDRSRPIALGGTYVRSLGTEDLLLVLSLHAAKHSWESLCWIRDISAVIRNPKLDWQWVLGEAERLGALRILLISLYLCRQLLGAELPPLVLVPVAADHEVAAVGQEVIWRMQNGGRAIPALEAHRLLLRTRSRWRDKVRYATRVIFTPGVSDWSLLALPAVFVPFYPLIRLGRLATKLMRGAPPPTPIRTRIEPAPPLPRP